MGTACALRSPDAGVSSLFPSLRAAKPDLRDHLPTLHIQEGDAFCRPNTTGILRSPDLRRNPLKEALPATLLVVSAAAWGVFWIPLRAFESAGFPAGATVAGQFIMPALVLLPFAVILATRGRATGLAQWHTGLFTGGAFALYADSLLLTEIARALILFYVSPAWSTALEIWLLKKRLTLARVVAMLLGFAGLYVLLGGDGSLPVPRNAGDWMAITAGIIWAWGSTRVRLFQDVGHFENVLSFFLYGAVVASSLMLFPLAGLGPLPSAAAIIDFLPWFLLIAAGFLLPVVFLQLYACKWLDPAKVGILLQAEVVFGVVSAAILTSEPFGWQEATGFVLVLSSALTEIFVNRSVRT